MAKLLCVAPADIERYWPAVEHLLRAAIDRVGLSDFDEDITPALFTGSHLLWIAEHHGDIEAAATTELRKVNDRKICLIVACSGDDMPNWIGLIDQIEAYAKAEGCVAMSVIGRRGWAKVLHGYDLKYAILEKTL